MKRTVKDKRADIQQIQKYLNGELNARAMHKLEREAQGDPFLMDALEGYGRAGNQQDNLASLQERLQARTTAKTRRIIPWTVISIAASVIGFAIVVGVLYKGGETGSLQKVATTTAPKKLQPADTTPVVVDKEGDALIAGPQKKAFAYNKKPTAKAKADIVTDKSADNTIAMMREISPKQDDVLKSVPEVTPLEDMVATDYMASKKLDTVLGGERVAITKKPSELTVLKSKADGADMTVRPGKQNDNNPSVLMAAGLPSNLVSGVVLNRNNGSPLAGVSVKVVGKTTATQTDANVKFTLPNVKKDETLAFGSVGYNSKTLDVKGKDSLKVELDENSNSLSEVVVARASQKVKAAKARPYTGWDVFNKYLKDNANTPDGKEGTVGLTFTVNANGSIANIKIVKSLSIAADNKAISLIKDGPAWSGNINGKAEEVKVMVEFGK
ncbi:TonB family protein [Mucilaginibacter terrigena]|uniref:TonB family protein n=1 Tax=Mucilaginibacter terrigena TaxID=2492395 RepID=A0A4Q5LJ11_9SPHI|nr:energy transducer TonB [Mucilaginibacter terrigena]RYU86201.1 TonB family protein [Mucilaginibacter terrigena]